MLYARDGVFESRVAPTPGLFAPAADVTRPCRRFISVARGSAMCWSALRNLRAFVSSVCLWGGTSRRLSLSWNPWAAMDMACCAVRSSKIRSDVHIPKDIPVLTLPSMQAMMCEDTRCIALAAFGSDDDLQTYLEGFSRTDKKKKVNAAEAVTGMTPLLAACRRDAVVHVRILLAFGADPNKANFVGWTPLMAATRHASSNPKIIEMLHEGGIEGSGGYIEPGVRNFFT